MVKKDQVIIDEAIRRVECRMETALRNGRMGIEVHGNPPDGVMHALEQSAPQLAASILITAIAKWN